MTCPTRHISAGGGESGRKGLQVTAGTAGVVRLRYSPRCMAAQTGMFVYLGVFVMRHHLLRVTVLVTLAATHGQRVSGCGGGVTCSTRYRLRVGSPLFMTLGAVTIMQFFQLGVAVLVGRTARVMTIFA